MEYIKFILILFFTFICLYIVLKYLKIFKNIVSKKDTILIEINTLLENKNTLINQLIEKFKVLNIDGIDNINNTDKFKNNEYLYDNKLDDIYLECLNIIENNQNINKNNEIITIKYNINDTNNYLIGAKKCFNKNILEYNNLIRKFPYNIIAKLKTYSEIKEFNTKRFEIYEILKEQKDIK